MLSSLWEGGVGAFELEKGRAVGSSQQESTQTTILFQSLCACVVMLIEAGLRVVYGDPSAILLFAHLG